MRFPDIYALGEQPPDGLVVVTAESVIEEAESHADHGAGEEAREDDLLLHLDLGQGPRQVVDAQAEEGDHA